MHEDSLVRALAQAAVHTVGGGGGPRPASLAGGPGLTAMARFGYGSEGEAFRLSDGRLYFMISVCAFVWHWY